MASRRNYVTAAEVLELAGFTPTDVQISKAEEMIDAYVGPQDRFFTGKLARRASAGGANTLTLHTDDQNQFDVDYLKWCEIEIIGGTGVGQRRIITGSTRAGVVTVDTAWATPPDATSFYSIYQLGKFPRSQDVVYYSQEAPFTYYKQIPEAVKRATAFQCEFMNAMGDTFFSTDKSDKNSESIGDYSYSRSNNAGSSGGGSARLIAPKAKDILHGIVNRTGEIVL